MDDTRRNIAGSAGGVLVVGGIAWYGTWFFASAHREWWGWIPGAVMFLIGAGLLVWGFRTPNPKPRVLAQLDDALHEAGVLQSLAGWELGPRVNQWSIDTSTLLRRWLGREVSQRFQDAGSVVPQDQGGAVVNARVAELTVIRDELQAGRIGLVRR